MTDNATTETDTFKSVPTPDKGTYTLTIEDKSCNLKALDRATFKIVLGMIAPGGKDPKYVDAGQIILKTCWISGDEELKDDISPENAELNCSACLKACELIEIKEGSIKKN